MEKKIAWNKGGGYITLSYNGEGNGAVTITSDPNNGSEERSMNITVSTTKGKPTLSRTVMVTQQPNMALADVWWDDNNFNQENGMQVGVLPVDADPIFTRFEAFSGVNSAKFELWFEDPFDVFGYSLELRAHFENTEYEMDVVKSRIDEKNKVEYVTYRGLDPQSYNFFDFSFFNYNGAAETDNTALYAIAYVRLVELNGIPIEYPYPANVKMINNNKAEING